MQNRSITLIAGPTASGKSDFAINLARESGSVIINADSMQVYDVLRVITARPSDEDIRHAPHYLYGHINPAFRYSTGQWLKDVKKLLDSLPAIPLIFVGGTGLYFKGLLEGMAEIPSIPSENKLKWQQKIENEGIKNLYAMLMEVDEALAQRLNPNDNQRIIRGLEVFETTGRTLTWWQKKTTKPLIENKNIKKILLLPKREDVYSRIEKRFDQMVENGALNEVRRLVELKLDPTLPAMKAIGVPEFINVLNEKETLNTAIEKAKTQTRRYAKRQMTWFRNQFDQSWEIN